MNRKMLTLIAVPLLAVALAASAVAFVPGILNVFSAGPMTATSIGAPAWKVGDTWTYNVSLASMDERQVLPEEMILQPTPSSDALVAGTLTETVVGNVPTPYGPAWNTTVDATLGFGEPAPANGTQPVLQPVSMHAATVTGFVWYRTSDLAPIYALKTVSMGGTWTVSAGTITMFGTLANATYSLSYTSTTQVWYRPPLAVWHFPLVPNESWNVSSNATVHFASTFDLMGPNVTFATNHSATFTVPLDFAMRTGAFENLTTPAGTFHSLSVWATHREFPEVSDADASATMNLTGDMDLSMPRVLASAWFSGQVGNVVRADLGLGLYGPRVELDLVSYSYT